MTGYIRLEPRIWIVSGKINVMRDSDELVRTMLASGNDRWEWLPRWLWTCDYPHRLVTTMFGRSSSWDEAMASVRAHVLDVHGVML